MEIVGVAGMSDHPAAVDAVLVEAEHHPVKRRNHRQPAVPGGGDPPPGQRPKARKLSRRFPRRAPQF